MTAKTNGYEIKIQIKVVVMAINKDFKNTFILSPLRKTIFFVLLVLLTWRKREDSNLRDACAPTRFRVVRLQPLGHASTSNSTTVFYKMPHESQKYVIIVLSPLW